MTYPNYMKNFFVVFKKQEGEIENAYSIVDEETYKTIPTDVILRQEEFTLDPALTTQTELQEIRDSLL